MEQQVDLMTFFKQLLTSRTVWSGIATIVCGILSAYGVIISPEDHLTLTEIGLTVATCIAGITTIVFRYKATKIMGDVQNLPKPAIK